MVAALPDILFASPALQVRRVAVGDGRRIVITFEPFHEESGFNRAGFGEAFFADAGLDAIHVLCRDSAWFQHADTAAALAAIRAAAAGAERCVTYGSSMGGYAALRFADAVGAEAVLALSPQYSVNHARAPFEDRWIEPRRRIRFRPDLDGPIRCGARAFVAYDPTIPTDRQHHALIAADIAVTALPLPYAGHPVGPFLAETGLLRPLVLDLMADRFDPGALIADAGARAEGSAIWWSERAREAADPVEAAALARRAAAIAPDNAAILDKLALSLRNTGDHNGAIAAHRAALALEPINDFRWGLSRTLFAAGDFAGARREAEALAAAAPGVAGYHRWVGEIALAMADRRGALRALTAAVHAAPHHSGYRRHALWLRLRLLLDRLRGR